MKVKELIKVLEQLNQEAEIKHYSLIDSEYKNVEGVTKIIVEEFECYIVY